MLSAEKFRELLVKRAFEIVKSLRERIIILVTCGCLRGHLISMLVSEGVVVIYRELSERPYVKPYVDGVRVIVYERVDDVVKIVTRHADRRVFVVVENTADAQHVAAGCGEVRECRAMVVLLPSIYKEALEEIVGRDRELKNALGDLRDFEVRYEIPERAVGIPPGPLCHVLRGEVSRDDVRRARDAFDDLSPDAIGVNESLLKDLGVKVPIAIIAGLTNLFFVNLFVTIISAFAGQKAELIGKILPEGFKEAVKSCFAKIIKRRDAGDKLAGPMAKLIRAVMEIQTRKYIDDKYKDVYEAFIDNAAAKLGMTRSELVNLVRNLFAMTRGRIVTESDLERLKSEITKEVIERIESEIRKRIEGELESLRRKLEELDERAKKLGIASSVYWDPGKLGIDLGEDKDKARLLVDSVDYRLVTSGRFKHYAEDITGKIKRDGMAVIVGPKGVGKSVLARYVLAGLLDSGDVHLVVDVRDTSNLGEFLTDAKKTGFPIALLYDPSPYEYYYYEYADKLGKPLGEHEPLIGRIDYIVDRLISRYTWAHSHDVREVSFVIVLSDDVFNTLVERREDVKSHAVNVDLRDRSFIADIIRSYGEKEVEMRVERREISEDDKSRLIKLIEDSAESLAKLVVDSYRGGYTLVAKYVGVWLGRGAVKDVAEALDRARGDAKMFLKRYIVDVVFGYIADLAFGRHKYEFEERVMSYAFHLMAHALFGELPRDLGRYNVVEALKGGRAETTGPEHLDRWVVEEHEDLLEEALRELVLQAMEEEPKEIDEFRKFKKPIWNAWRKISDVRLDDKSVVFKGLGIDVDIGWAGDLYRERIRAAVESKDKKALAKLVLSLLTSKFLAETLRRSKSWEALFKHLALGYYRISIPADYVEAGRLEDRSGNDLSGLLLSEDKTMPFSIRYAVHWGGLPFILERLLKEEGISLEEEACKAAKKVREELASQKLERDVIVYLVSYLAYSLACRDPRYLAEAITKNLSIFGNDFFHVALAERVFLLDWLIDDEVQARAMLMLRKISSFDFEYVIDLGRRYVDGNFDRLHDVARAVLTSVLSEIYRRSYIVASDESALRVLHSIKSERLRNLVSIEVYTSIADGDLAFNLVRAEEHVKMAEDLLKGIEQNLGQYEKDEAISKYLSIGMLRPDLKLHLKYYEGYLHSVKAKLLMHRGYLDDAAEEFKRSANAYKALDDDTNYYAAEVHLARIKAVMGNVEIAAEEIVEMSREWWPYVLRHPQRSAFVSEALVSLAVLGGNFEEALKRYEPFLREDPRVSAIMYLMIHVITGDPEYYKMGVDEARRLPAMIEEEIVRRIWSELREQLRRLPEEERKKVIEEERQRREEELKAVYEWVTRAGCKAQLDRPWLLLHDGVSSLVLALLFASSRESVCLDAIRRLSLCWKDELSKEGRFGPAMLWEGLYEASKSGDWSKVRNALIRMYYFHM